MPRLVLKPSPPLISRHSIAIRSTKTLESLLIENELHIFWFIKNSHIVYLKSKHFDFFSSMITRCPTPAFENKISPEQTETSYKSFAPLTPTQTCVHLINNQHLTRKFIALVKRYLTSDLQKHSLCLHNQRITITNRSYIAPFVRYLEGAYINVT